MGHLGVWFFFLSGQGGHSLVAWSRSLCLEMSAPLLWGRWYWGLGHTSLWWSWIWILLLLWLWGVATSCSVGTQESLKVFPQCCCFLKPFMLTPQSSLTLSCGGCILLLSVVGLDCWFPALPPLLCISAGLWAWGGFLLSVQGWASRFSLHPLGWPTFAWCRGRDRFGDVAGFPPGADSFCLLFEEGPGCRQASAVDHHLVLL